MFLTDQEVKNLTDRVKRSSPHKPQPEPLLTRRDTQQRYWLMPIATPPRTSTRDELDIGFINEGGYIPPTDWPQGGPIIEREGITLRCGLYGWDAELEEFDASSHGPTALIAAMRCYVASKLGEEVDVPDELIESMK